MCTGVAHGQVLRAQRAAGGRTSTERHGELDFADGTVRVLGEDHPVGNGTTQGVAHDLEHTEPE